MSAGVIRSNFVNKKGRIYQKGYPLHEDVRRAIVEEIKWACGNKLLTNPPFGTYSRIARQFHIHGLTVAKLWKHFCHFKTVKPLDRTGKPRTLEKSAKKVTKDDLEYLEQLKLVEHSKDVKSLSIIAVRRAVKYDLPGGPRNWTQGTCPNSHTHRQGTCPEGQTPGKYHLPGGPLTWRQGTSPNSHTHRQGTYSEGLTPGKYHLPGGPRTWRQGTFPNS